jgi:hypothetical protein
VFGALLTPPAGFTHGLGLSLLIAAVVAIGAAATTRMLITRTTRPTTSWVVEVDGRLYVPSYHGPDGAWYRQARRTHLRGRITAGRTTYDVTFDQPTTGVDSGAIDAAYRHKYASHGRAYVEAMVTPRAATATLRLDPASPKEEDR